MAIPDPLTATATHDHDTPDADIAQIGGQSDPSSSLPVHNQGLPVAIATPVCVIHHFSTVSTSQGSACVNSSVDAAANHNANRRQTSGLTETSDRGNQSAPSNTKGKSPGGWKAWVESHKPIVFGTVALLALTAIVGIVVSVTLNSGSKETSSSALEEENAALEPLAEFGSSGPPGKGLNGNKSPLGVVLDASVPVIPAMELTTTSLCDASVSSCEWLPVGPDLLGPAPGDFFGSILTLGKNPNGSRIVVSAPFSMNKAGYIAVYDIVEEGTSPMVYQMFGRDIVPKYMNDQLIGTMSDDGRHLVVSSIYANSQKGHAKAFLLLESGDRMPLGNEFNGFEPNDEFGRVVINRDGTILAISDILFDPIDRNFENSTQDAGIVRIYSCPHYGEVCPYWKPLGKSFITGKTIHEEFGKKMSLSWDGKKIAIGTNDYDAGNVLEDIDYGIVRTYYLNEELDEWELLGQEIIGNAGDKLGKEIKLSADGSFLAVATNEAWVNDDGKEGIGLVRVYGYDLQQNLWKPIGNDILSGTEDHLDFGIQIDFSDDGRRIAVGQARYTPEQMLFQAGRIQIFDLIDGSWTQVGEDIVGVRNCDVVGTGFDLSPDGSRIIVGFPNAEGMGAEGPECAKDDGGDPVVGFVRLYQVELY
mmetsp:Transcript_26942/g.54136  ORF Transcript_26942/g.54136 Transcript_26942/m.54136 type:complete len:645 (+) Transcript_26942:110-2044(+)